MTDSHEQREIEEGGNAWGGNVGKVRKLTEETPDVHSIKDITEAAPEDRQVEKLH